MMKKYFLKQGIMKEIIVNKITLEQLIDMLIQVHESGADFIDLVVRQGNTNQDFLGILVREEYLNFEQEEEEELKLTNDSINQLLDI
jgi:hypothetical protein